MDTVTARNVIQSSSGPGEAANAEGSSHRHTSSGAEAMLHT
jgi:hypothetical protein